MKNKPKIIATTWGRQCSIDVEYPDLRITRYSMSPFWRVALWLSSPWHCAAVWHMTGLTGAVARHLTGRSTRFGAVPGPWVASGRATAETIQQPVPYEERMNAELNDDPGSSDMFAAALKQFEGDKS